MVESLASRVNAIDPYNILLYPNTITTHQRCVIAHQRCVIGRQHCVISRQRCVIDNGLIDVDFLRKFYEDETLKADRGFRES